MSEIFILNMLFLQHGVKYEGQEQVSIKLFVFTTNVIYQCQKQTIVWFQECFPLLYMQPEETTTVVLMEICRLDGFIGIILLTVDNV